MNRVLGRVGAVVALCLAVAVPSFAGVGTRPSLSVPTQLSMPDDANGGTGSSVAVPISASPADGILAIDVTVTYDPAILQVQSVSREGIAQAANFAIEWNVPAPGTVAISLYALGDALSGSGEVARIHFLVNGSPSTTPSSLHFASASINEDGIPVTFDDGHFTATCTGVADGTTCNDGEAICTPVDTCQGGFCVGTPLPCDDGNPCTADFCQAGVGCQHPAGNVGTICRASAGACDIAETCTGTSATCPTDGFRPNTYECRGSTGQCDVAETCTGTGPACPADAFAGAAIHCNGGSQGAACDNDPGDHCSGTANTCVDVFQSSATVCRPAAAGGCDVAESCTGTSGTCPADAFASSSTSCTGASQGGACDNDVADHCLGTANTCVDVFQSSATVCRSAAAGGCDVAESCTGTSGTCPADAFAPSSTSCTGASQGGPCNNDAADHCLGTANTCVDVFQSSATVCRSAAAGGCDVAESCTGTSGTCPADAFASSSTSCTGASQGGACDNDAADHCTGTSNSCVDVFQSSATVCRGAAGQCDVAESCTGSSGACPADVLRPNGFACSDGNACTLTDTCQSGACVGTSPVVCNDSNPCTDDSCNTLSGSCVYVANNANTCTDGNVCTSDACSGGSCVHAPSGVCGITGSVLYYRDFVASSEPSSKPVPNVGIDRTQDAIADATTGSSGTYSLGSVSGDVVVTTVPKLGSPRASDHNGAITGTDAAQIARSVVGLVTLSTNQRIAGDVTGNGTISSLDAAQVARFAAFLVDHFDVANTTGSDWKFLRCDAYAFPGDPGCGTASYNFTPVTQSESGKNFYAVLYGDVTGNWAPASLFTPASAPAADPVDLDRLVFAEVPSKESLAASAASDAHRAPGPAVLTVDRWTTPLRPGERRDLTIHLWNADGILGLDLSVLADPSQLAVVGVRSTGIADGWGVAHGTVRKEERVAAYGVTPLAGSGAVLVVTVEGRAAAGALRPPEIRAVANEGAIPLRVTRAEVSSSK